MALEHTYPLTYSELEKLEGFDKKTATGIETVSFLNDLRKSIGLTVVGIEANVPVTLMETENHLRGLEYVRKKKALGYSE